MINIDAEIKHHRWVLGHIEAAYAESKKEKPDMEMLRFFIGTALLKESTRVPEQYNLTLT